MTERKRYYAKVMHGTISHTPGGLTKKNIKTKRVDGTRRFVSKKKSNQAKKNFGDWNKAVAKAKKNLGIPKNEFVLLRKSSKLYKEASKIYYD